MLTYKRPKHNNDAYHRQVNPWVKQKDIIVSCAHFNKLAQFEWKFVFFQFGGPEAPKSITGVNLSFYLPIIL